MKTADLIPFILLELNECDKYGFELTKSIETKSNGKIVIKQPTLYTLLKKLEKSKFIASYWQDSEIGGKRHYYKLTENGKLQASTLPSYDTLLKNALAEETDKSDTQIDAVQTQENQKTYSVMEELTFTPPTPTETILPSGDVFEEKSLDNATELDINISNTEILKNENESIDEQFATNSDVIKFTEKITKQTSIQTAEPVSNPTNGISLIEVEFATPKNDMEIKFVDYIDFKNSNNYKLSKKMSTNKLWEVLSTSASLVLMLIICTIVTSFTGRSVLYYLFFISSVLIALFYPIIYAININKFRLKLQKETYEAKTKIKLFVGLPIMLTTFILCVVVSICVGKNTIGAILSIKNFANFYAPIFMSSVYFLNVLYNYIFLTKLNK